MSSQYSKGRNSLIQVQCAYFWACFVNDALSGKNKTFNIREYVLHFPNGGSLVLKVIELSYLVWISTFRCIYQILFSNTITATQTTSNMIFFFFFLENGRFTKCSTKKKVINLKNQAVYEQCMITKVIISLQKTV